MSKKALVAKGSTGHEEPANPISEQIVTYTKDGSVLFGPQKTRERKAPPTMVQAEEVPDEHARGRVLSG